MKKVINKMNLALFLPALGLFIFIVYQQIRISTGTQVILPIVGYDPRDLLSGHYLTYTINFDPAEPCVGLREGEQYICLEPKYASVELPNNCQLFIKGKCRSGRFEAGIERFYIPEKDSIKLNDLVRDKKASILISVSFDGIAKLKDLLLDGKPWKEVELESSTNP